MSIHYNTPHVFTKCHAVDVINNAAKEQLLDVSMFDVKPDLYGLSLSIPVVADVTWDTHKMKFMGSVFDTCSKASVEYYETDIGYLYPVNQISDYGDEGSINLVGYLVSAFDLFDKFAHLFDRIE